MDSTNSKTKELIENNLEGGLIVVATEQKKGRGRLGKKWDSPAEDGLYFSVLLDTRSLKQEKITMITLMTAAALAETIEEEYQLTVGIKWPNDLLINSKKFCGILTEAITSENKINHIIIGIGINVNNKNFDTNVDNKYSRSSLYLELGNKIDKAELLALFINRLEQYYFAFINESFDYIIDRWTNYALSINQEVTINRQNEYFQALLIGVNNKGELIIMRDGNIQYISSAELII